MEVESTIKQVNGSTEKVAQLVSDIPPEFWEEIEFEEARFAEMEISMNKDEEQPDLSKPIMGQNGKPLSLRYISNPIKVLKFLYNETLIDEENDIKKDFYEGGFKIWECTIDLLKYLDEILLPFELKGKNVIDVGCGHGLLGLEALLCGANSVYFQDFNLEVLKFAVVPNFYLNGITELLHQSRFISGDWSKTYEKIVKGDNDINVSNAITSNSQTPTKFDLILMSEVLYCKENYQKLARLITDLLSQNGMCLISTKLYYFGCSGSLPDFREYIREFWPQLSYKSVKKITNKMSNKREIIALTLTQ